MSIHRFATVQRLPIALDEAWDFFSNPRNLERITPPDMRFEITSPLPERVYAGLIVTYKVRPLAGVPVTWVTEIDHVEDGRLFVDTQLMGPYRLWHHQHHFLEIPGGVEMRDIVHYAPPFGPAGPLLNALLLRRRIEAIFEHRHHVLVDRFGAWPGDEANGTAPQPAATPGTTLATGTVAG
ncbi:MAG: SRPBCC family protein [Dehalococcoidia bacterium]